MDLCLAIDIGGTKLAVGLVSGAGDLLGARRAPTPHGDDADALFAALVTLIDGVLGDEHGTVFRAPTWRCAGSAAVDPWTCGAAPCRR